MRGPIVYCLEEADVPDGVAFEDLRLVTSEAPREQFRDDLLKEPVVTPVLHGGGAAVLRCALVGGARRTGRSGPHPVLRMGEPGAGRDARLVAHCRQMRAAGTPLVASSTGRREDPERTQVPPRLAAQVLLQCEQEIWRRSRK